MVRVLHPLFVVPLANNNSGKTTLVNALLEQALGAPSPGQKGSRRLRSPLGQEIDAYVFVRSFQETEKSAYRTVLATLDANDPLWRDRQLIVLPSHLDPTDVSDIIATAHSAGFDAIAASMSAPGTFHQNHPLCWAQAWDERWRLGNARDDTGWRLQVQCLARDLWIWICKTLFKS